MVAQPSRASEAAATILSLVVALAPFPFGSTDGITICVWSVLLSIALFLSAWSEAGRSQMVFLGCMASLAALWGLVVFEQLSLRPWFGAAPDGAWQEVSSLLNTHIPGTLSIAKDLPLFAVGAQIVVFLTLASSYLLGHDRVLAERLVRIFAWSGLAYALFGIASLAVDPNRILWRAKEAYQGVLTSTFVNRNTAAAYFGCCAIVWLSFLIRSLRPKLNEEGRFGLRQMLVVLLGRPPRRSLVALSALFVVFAAMLMTSSRAGSLLSIMALMAFLLTEFRESLSSPKALAGGLLLAVVVGVLLIEVLGTGVSSRIGTQGLADGGRWQTYQSTVRMIADHPWLGTGLGTYAWIYPSYRSPDISGWGTWDRAHNTLLELAAELGVPFACLIALGWVAILSRLFAGLGRSARPGSNLSRTAFFVALVAVCHSLVDFSLQIPGFAICAVTIVGLGLAAAEVHEDPSKSGEARR